jgi:hypothetical protein
MKPALSLLETVSNAVQHEVSNLCFSEHIIIMALKTDVVFTTESRSSSVGMIDQRIMG